MSAPKETPPSKASLRTSVRRDTIVAVATAPGRGAIAMVRLSGADAERIGRRVCARWPEHPRHATHARLHQCDNPAVPLDDAMVTRFEAPHSYTGETVVEFATHGGLYVPLVVCAALVEAGARLALPGEFTERAVLNGKMDLLRAEAVADLIDARSRAAHREALHQLDGALSRRLGLLRELAIGLDALLAYDIDFPSEDDGPLPRARVLEACDVLLAHIGALLATVPVALLGREGAMVVLAGPPNAGKSSLLNALVGESRVIVSDIPGTTRDAVEVVLEHDPWPLRLVDTAGLRASTDALEQLGIAVSARYMTAAHVVVVCAETPETLQAAVRAVQDRTAAPIIGALTKADLVSNSYKAHTLGVPVVAVSATTATGLAELLALVTTAVASTIGNVPADVPALTRARHRSALAAADAELQAFRVAWAGEALPAPVASTHVRAAILALDDLIGTVDVEDVFARVFATFCVGK